MDGSSLATVESAALTQGVAFLYAQAGDLLRRRREARDRAATARERHSDGEFPDDAHDAHDAHDTDNTDYTDDAPGSLPTLRLPESSFQSVTAAPPAPALATLDHVAGDLFQARRDVDEYVVGDAALGSDAPEGLAAVDQLRRILEEIYNAEVTFRGERRVPAGGTNQVQARHVGVTGNNINAKYIAGRDINVKRA